MNGRTGAPLLSLFAGGCWGLGAAATEPAEVLGEPVPHADPAQLRETILTRLFDQYAAERGIRAESAEIDALLKKVRGDMAARGLATEDDFTPEEQQEVDAMPHRPVGGSSCGSRRPSGGPPPAAASALDCRIIAPRRCGCAVFCNRWRPFAARLRISTAKYPFRSLVHVHLPKVRNRMTKTSLLAIAVLFSAAGATQAANPSFNCAKASGSVEELICNDAELASLDRSLSSLYSAVLKNTPPSEQGMLKTEQRGWIKGRNDCWKSDDMRGCVANEYRYRINELKDR